MHLVCLCMYLTNYNHSIAMPQLFILSLDHKHINVIYKNKYVYPNNTELTFIRIPFCNM